MVHGMSMVAAIGPDITPSSNRAASLPLRQNRVSRLQVHHPLSQHGRLHENVGLLQTVAQELPSPQLAEHVPNF